MALSIETCVARHTGDRAEQQDRVGVFAHPTRANTMLAALADGMGGHSGGALAAEQVLFKARESFASYAPGGEEPQRFLDDVVNEAHLIIKLTRFTSEQDPHSTAVLFMLQPDGAVWAHCGDSRLYHFRGAKAVARTNDHSLVGQMVRGGRISADEALKHPRRNVLVSCLGSEYPPRIDRGQSGPLTAGDAFLLCSDGLWGNLRDSELAEAVSRDTPREAAQNLINQARSRAHGSGDNISLAIIKVVDRPNGA
jgi:serine/threonine protein phosphatase PrpC